MAESIKNKRKSNNPNGRPKGSTNKIRAADFFNGEERDLLIQQWKDKTIYADKPDEKLFMELIHQLFGKAKQSTELSGDAENPLKLIEIITNAKSTDKLTS